MHDSFGIQPTAYKAGRYGFGPATARLLEDEGFLVDTSLMPRTRYTELGGPDFARFDYGPFWFGSRRLLELPVTRALTGWLGGVMPGVYGRGGKQAVPSLARAGPAGTRWLAGTHHFITGGFRSGCHVAVDPRPAETGRTYLHLELPQSFAGAG